MKTIEAKLKGLTSKQKQTCKIIGGVIIILAIIFGLFSFLDYQHTQYQAHHAQIIQAERMAKTK